ncbi:MAG: hypothetical protein HUN04_26005 [Desulfobacter sp.]|nr:MAG: hypothetical protein HUN04_26005 [Desulfobacter sp.]
MKLTNSESIQESEKEFIDTINAELDWDAIEQMLLDKHGFSVQDDVDYKDGNLIVHNNEIAYKFDFEIKVPLSVIFNREGECLEISTRKEDDPAAGEEDEPGEATMENGPLSGMPPEERQARGGEMVSEIADMISEINKEGE